VNDCHWKFKEKVIFVQGHPVDLRMRHWYVNVRRIYVREDNIVAPGAEVNVPVMSLPYTTLHTPRSDWIVDPKTIAPGVIVARKLLPCRDKYAAIRLINVSGKPYSFLGWMVHGKS